MATLSDQVLALTTVELAAKIAAAEVSSEEVTRTYLDRIERLNDDLNAFVTVGRRRALFAARQHDKQRATQRSKGSLPPFWGVPTGIKDLNFTREFPTRFGSKAMRFRYLPIDDRLTQQMRAAGFVIVGKLATSEVGALPVTEPLIHGPTTTPWRADVPRSAGGSSGGSGAAVAAGMLPIAPGSDGAGSVRIPAAFNGLVGIKPSRGRIRNAFGLPEQTILYSDGPLARSVRDAAHLLDAMAGITVGKPTSVPAPVSTFAQAVERVPGRLRIHVSYHHELAATEPAIVQAVQRVAQLLTSAGHDVHEMPWLPMQLEDFLPVWQRAMAESRKIVGSRGLTPAVAWLTSTGKVVSKQFAEARKAEAAQRILTWFGGADVWISPTVAGVAPPLGMGGGADGEAAFRRTAPLGGFTAPFNVSGQPALTLPIGLSPDGLPMGVQLAGPMFTETTLLGLAGMLEAALPAMPRNPNLPW